MLMTSQDNVLPSVLKASLLSELPMQIIAILLVPGQQEVISSKILQPKPAYRTALLILRTSRTIQLRAVYWLVLVDTTQSSVLEHARHHVQIISTKIMWPEYVYQLVLLTQLSPTIMLPIALLHSVWLYVLESISLIPLLSPVSTLYAPVYLHFSPIIILVSVLAQPITTHILSQGHAKHPVMAHIWWTIPLGDVLLYVLPTPVYLLIGLLTTASLTVLLVTLLITLLENACKLVTKQ